MSHRIWQYPAVWLVAATLCAGVLSMGCDDTPRAKLSEGKQALAQGDYERAAQRLAAALDEDEELLEARRLKATARMEAGDYEVAERILEQLWEEGDYDDEGQLDGDERQTRQLISDQFSELYHRWAESIDLQEDPQRVEEIAWEGLKRNSRDSDLNRLLKDFYEQRADRYEEQSERLKAAEQLENIDELHRFPDTRRESRTRAEQLRREAFEEEALEQFEQRLRPDLVDNGVYDPDDQTLALVVEHPTDRGLKPEDTEAVDRARDTAVQMLMPTLWQYAAAMGGLDTDEVDDPPLDPPQLAVEDEQFHTASYEMTVSMHRDDLMEMAFNYHEYRRIKAEDEHPDAPQQDVLVEQEDVELDTTALEDED